MRLVPDARKALTWFSVQAMALAIAIEGAWMALPADIKAEVPETWVDAVTVGLLVLGIIGRLVKQGPQE
jgi:hypothetical protein